MKTLRQKIIMDKCNLTLNRILCAVKILINVHLKDILKETYLKNKAYNVSKIDMVYLRLYHVSNDHLYIFYNHYDQILIRSIICLYDSCRVLFVMPCFKGTH